jgi:diguanylate cyclase (GGDEF)-like protein/PAS domain S-box-containing protein
MSMSLNLDETKSRLFLQAFGLAAWYFLCSASAMCLTRFDGGVAIVWAAGAVLFGTLALTPRRSWPALVAAAFVGGLSAAVVFGFGGKLSVVLAIIGVSEAVVAAWLVKWASPRFGRFETLRETLLFLAIAGILVPAVSGLLAGASVHGMAGLSFLGTWRDWFAAHGLGLVVFAPPIILSTRALRHFRLSAIDPARMIEAGLCLAAVAFSALVTFGQNTIPLVLLPLVPMVAATFRLGRPAAVASILIVVAIGLGCSLVGVGPTTLLNTSMAAKFQVLQLYFACLVLILLPVAAELSARRRLVERLTAAESLHRLILDRTSDVVLRLNRQGVIEYVSPSVTNSWGCSAESLDGKSIFDVIHPDDVARLRQCRAEALADAECTRIVEYRVPRGSQGTIWVESHMRAIADNFGRVTGTVSIIREITQKRQAIEDLAMSALTDGLTGLYNRRAFDRALAAHLMNPAAGGPIGCVAIFDLDHFKRINDQFGHATGDVFLKRFASVLRSSVRDGDVTTRFGGEEFAVLFAGATVGQTYLACDRIRERFASCQEATSSGDMVHATVSVGIAQLVHGLAPDDQVARADRALYQAKNMGRNKLSVAA